MPTELRRLARPVARGSQWPRAHSAAAARRLQWFGPGAAELEGRPPEHSADWANPNTATRIRVSPGPPSESLLFSHAGRCSQRLLAVRVRLAARQPFAAFATRGSLPGCRRGAERARDARAAADSETRQQRGCRLTRRLASSAAAAAGAGGGGARSSSADPNTRRIGQQLPAERAKH